MSRNIAGSPPSRPLDIHCTWTIEPIILATTPSNALLSREPPQTTARLVVPRKNTLGKLAVVIIGKPAAGATHLAIVDNHNIFPRPGNLGSPQLLGGNVAIVDGVIRHFLESRSQSSATHRRGMPVPW